VFLEASIESLLALARCCKFMRRVFDKQKSSIFFGKRSQADPKTELKDTIGIACDALSTLQILNYIFILLVFHLNN
jgi:hypothetical protein